MSKAGQVGHRYLRASAASKKSCRKYRVSWTGNHGNRRVRGSAILHRRGDHVRIRIAIGPRPRTRRESFSTATATVEPPYAQGASIDSAPGTRGVRSRKSSRPWHADAENIAAADSSLEGRLSRERASRRRSRDLLRSLLEATRRLSPHPGNRPMGYGGRLRGRASLARPTRRAQGAVESDPRGRETEAPIRAGQAKGHGSQVVPHQLSTLVFGVGDIWTACRTYVMWFIQGLGLNVVLANSTGCELDAASPQAKLPTGGEIRISQRTIAAADVARSLMTGTFQKSDDSDKKEELPVHTDFAATVGQPAEGDPATGPLSSSQSDASGLSGSFTVSSSSITLPGGTAQKKSGKAQSYWQSVANIGKRIRGRHWSTPTSKAYCIATSSRRTCCWICGGRCGSPISVWRKWPDPAPTI